MRPLPLCILYMWHLCTPWHARLPLHSFNNDVTTISYWLLYVPSTVQPSMWQAVCSILAHTCVRVLILCVCTNITPLVWGSEFGSDCVWEGRPVTVILPALMWLLCEWPNMGSETSAYSSPYHAPLFSDLTGFIHVGLSLAGFGTMSQTNSLAMCIVWLWVITKKTAMKVFTNYRTKRI